MNEDKFLKQWHPTRKIEENGVLYFLKNYNPNSYEIKNEVSWLMSNMIKSCFNFNIPNIKEVDIEKGYVKMDHINAIDNKTKDELTNYLLSCAIELHSLIKSDNPKMRTQGVSKQDYSEYVKNFAKLRIDQINSQGHEIPDEIIAWILKQIEGLKVDYFTIVHRDLRARHLLFSDDSEKPTLIDWEFTNISEPAQDLAKIIYDGVMQNNLDEVMLKNKVIDIYSNVRSISKDEIEQKVMAFLPILPLEHSASFLERKPKGYEKEVLKDLLFIQTTYEKNK
jgi:hypothetical protein